MSSRDSKQQPPSYSEISKKSPSNSRTTARGLSNYTTTCSIKDGFVDYYKVVRESTSSYHICLTVDPSPLYRVEFVPNSSKVGDIQIFSASDPNLPAIAAARLSTDTKIKKAEPVATICTSEPFLPTAQWRPMIKASSMAVESHLSTLPIITVPGMAPTPHKFAWRAGCYGMIEPIIQLWWEGPLPMVPKSGFMHDQRGQEYVFAAVTLKTAESGVNLIELRRGGGLEFELSVMLELFVILHLQKRLFL